MDTDEKSIVSEIAAVIEAVKIESWALFRIGEDMPLRVTVAQTIPGTSPEHAYAILAAPLVGGLQSALYARCYSHRLEEPTVGHVSAPDPWLVDRLSQANASRERWDPGWQIYDVRPDGQVYVLKGDQQRSAIPGEYVADTMPGQPPSAGSVVTLKVTRESQQLQPGFYYMFGENPTDIWDDHYLVRFYFNCSAEGAPALIGYLTSTLNRYSVPFRMKALTDSSHYTRTDSMVLYCARRYFQIVGRIVKFLSVPERHLGRSVPLFTKKLRAGVGFAEDPGNGESFGMHRCRIVAEGIVDAWMQGYRDLARRSRAVQERFAMYGLKLDQPYLRPGSVDLFEVTEVGAAVR
jgi:type III HopA1-like effector protein